MLATNSDARTEHHARRFVQQRDLRHPAKASLQVAPGYRGDRRHCCGVWEELEEAAKSKSVNRGAEAIADEIAATYPFHPQLKNVIALFKENENFRQTRGLIELVSRLLRSVWERDANDIFLIGPQHFDLSIKEVREKLTEISVS